MPSWLHSHYLLPFLLHELITVLCLMLLGWLVNGAHRNKKQLHSQVFNIFMVGISLWRGIVYCYSEMLTGCALQHWDQCLSTYSTLAAAWRMRGNKKVKVEMPWSVGLVLPFMYLSSCVTWFHWCCAMDQFLSVHSFIVYRDVILP